MRPELQRGLQCLLAGLLLWPTLSAARSDDQKQPIRIEADRVTLDEPRGMSIYEGHVHLSQGSIRLRAAAIRVFVANKALKQVVAEGSPVTFTQTSDDGKEIQAEAQRMEYDAKTHTIILLGQARLWQGNNLFASERIEYNTLDEVVNAGDAQGTQRVEVILIPPEQDKTAPEAPAMPDAQVAPDHQTTPDAHPAPQATP